MVDWGIGTGNVGPIFSVGNMAPGDTQTHTVTVTNNAPEARPVGIRGVVTSQTGNLSDAMFITITRDGSDIYGGSTGTKTLTQFFSESTLPHFVDLMTVNPSESETFTVTVVFDLNAGNEFQNRTLTFNLILGIAIDIPEACSGIKFQGEPIYGTAGNDRLKGTNKNDLIIALEGNDTVDGGNGDDCIIDSSGNGTLEGGNGNDVIVNGNGNATLNGGNGKDILIAGNGNDKLLGGNDDDRLFGEGEDDTLDGGNGNDEIFGGAGDDTMLGGNGNDNLQGGEGNDKADGELGKDTCVAETKKSCEA